MKKFLLGLLSGIITILATAYIVWIKYSKRDDYKRAVLWKYKEKTRELAEKGDLAYETAREKEKEAKHEVFTEERDAVVARFMSHFDTGSE